jgi:NAD(P)-dependent dehydrogenase (short-subunit alcohol dehydrogenase family)
VITGSTKGLGLALAEQFLQYGDAVVVSSRDAGRCQAAAADLAARFPGATISAFPADVSVAEQVR